ncbi:lipopolysaccharide biosynthesis protein [Polluticoccus soli]|uniref:lipopolysaccharide biosynthesis protein n=1 Tax=Polluticoccus soli TaxID=3034150 RepID=UPI0023E12D52|nr:hypothetical protein [Flavipsychrobacter sp. JY13-12]
MKLLQQEGNNSFVTNSLFIFLVRFFPSLANLLIVIAFSRYLDRAEYGIYQEFWVRLQVLSTVACVGLQAFLVTYQPVLVAAMIRSLSVKSIFKLIGWICFCAAVLAAMQADNFNWTMAFAFLVIYSLSIILESVLISFRQYGILVFSNLIYTVLFCIAHWLVLSERWSIEKLFSILLILVAAKLLATYIAFKKALAGMPALSNSYDLRSAKTLWAHLGVYDISQILFRWIDKFIITLIFTDELSAIYYNGSLEIPFLPLLLGAVGSAALMQLSGLGDHDKSVENAISVVNRSGKVLSSIVFPLFFFFLVFRKELFLVLLSDKYLQSVPIFAMAILAMPLKTYSFTTILQNRHRGDIINKGAVFDLVLALVLMYPLYIAMGLPGVALSFVISTYLQAGYYLYHSGRELRVSPVKLIPAVSWSIKLIVFASSFIALYYLFAANYSPEIVLVLGSSFLVFVSVVSLYIELIVEKRKHDAAEEIQI